MFKEQIFRTNLDKESPESDQNKIEVAEFHEEFLSMLNKHAPLKNVYIGANNPSYITV